jgi:Ca-activated chloride channel homolog
MHVPRRAEGVPVIPVVGAFLLLLQGVISVRTELVAVPVTVTDGRGQHVAGLTQDNFRVYDNGRLQPIAVFDSGDAPVALGVVVDRSQSMRPKAAALRTALSSLLESSGPDDELFGVNFHDGASLALGREPFTHDAKELATALSAVRAAGRTALYDGVAEGLRHLERGRSQKRALIVISDGGDNASRLTYAQVRVLARRSDAVIYAIGLSGTGVAQEEEDAGLLKRLSRETGGIAYFPRSIEETAAVASQIARDLREQYTLGFSPVTSPNGEVFRKITVTVSAARRGRLHVRTRSGYIAAPDTDGRQ